MHCVNQRVSGNVHGTKNSLRIYKVELFGPDMDRHYYETANKPTVAQTPSETDNL